MNKDSAVLHILVGKICSGKSTLANKLGQSPKTIVIAEDEWLFELFGNEMHDISDYVRYSARLRSIMKSHLVGLLKSGLSVVLDFAANTPEMRSWMREICEAAGCGHRLHFLDVSDEECRQRLHIRNAEGKHPFRASDDQFDMITSYFIPPSAKEGFEITRYETGSHPQ